jgi:hypothetical protein
VVVEGHNEQLTCTWRTIDDIWKRSKSPVDNALYGLPLLFIQVSIGPFPRAGFPTPAALFFLFA